MDTFANNERRTILVTGASGRQGGAVARALRRPTSFLARFLVAVSAGCGSAAAVTPTVQLSQCPTTAEPLAAIDRTTHCDELARENYTGTVVVALEPQPGVQPMGTPAQGIDSAQPAGMPAAVGPAPGGSLELHLAGTYHAVVTVPPNARHNIVFTVNQDGTVEGESEWPQTGLFKLVGRVNQIGELEMRDDAHVRFGYDQGIYTGIVAGADQAAGLYFEGSTDNFVTQWIASRANPASVAGSDLQDHRPGLAALGGPGVPIPE